MKADDLKDLHREKRTFNLRVAIASVVALGLIGVLLSRLYNLQILQQSYYATRADENRTRLVPVAPVRGLIYDRNGVLLAQNSPSFVLEVVPEQVDNLDKTIARLRALVSLDRDQVTRFKERVRKTPRYRAVPLRMNLSLQEVANFEVNRFDFKGVDVAAGLTRNYPLGASASHVIGYVGGINEDELKKVDPKMYEGLSLIGKTGIEKSHEDMLRGSPGTKIIEANAYGRPLRELDYKSGYAGSDLILSLDTKVQLVAEEALGDLQGAVIAIDPRTGEIIALVSKPGYDPGLFVEGLDAKTYRTLLEDESRPLYNRALQGIYPPGSTIKPFMALAGLEYQQITPSHAEYCPGFVTLPGSSRRYRCWRRSGHGTLNMRGGIMRSCDVYFYRLAMNLGIDRIHEFLDTFGLGRPTGVDLPLEKTGVLPSREWKRKARHQVWFPGETLSVGIGQGYMSVTPMQLAQMTARMAMRGAGFKPHLVKALQDPITRVVTPVEPEALPPILNRVPSEWEEVVHAMEDVAHTQGGTAYAVFKDAPYRAAAKTGSAQIASLAQNSNAPDQEDLPLRQRDHALLVAFAPADNPQIAVAVIAEHGGHGGSAAGPVAREVIDQYLLGKVLYGQPKVVVPPTTAAPTLPGTPQ